MTKPHFRFRLKVFIGIFATLLVGCSGTPTKSNYYLLNAFQNIGAVEIMKSDEGGVILGLGPVTLPEYVNRVQVVTRTSRNEITFSEYDRWAEPLKMNVIRVLKENLAELLHTDGIFVYPWPLGSAVEYIVTADVIRFDAQPADSSVLEVRWSLSRGNDRKLILNKKSRFETPVKSSRYDDLVASLSSGLNEFSREVATAVAQSYRGDQNN
jgi:uncharacterized lipoprotein YmbA